MTPDVILQGGAIAVFLLVFAGAVRGDIRFRPGTDGELEAKDEYIAFLERELVDRTAHRDRLTAAVEKLGDALESRNRRDERSRREQ